MNNNQIIGEIDKNNFFLLAKNISRSKILNRGSIPNSNRQKNKKIEINFESNSNSLIYKNILLRNNRSRSLKQMMSSLMDTSLNQNENKNNINNNNINQKENNDNNVSNNFKIIDVNDLKNNNNNDNSFINENKRNINNNNNNHETKTFNKKTTKKISLLTSKLGKGCVEYFKIKRNLRNSNSPRIKENISMNLNLNNNNKYILRKNNSFCKNIYKKNNFYLKYNNNNNDNKENDNIKNISNIKIDIENKNKNDNFQIINIVHKYSNKSNIQKQKFPKNLKLNNNKNIEYPQNNYNKSSTFDSNSLNSNINNYNNNTSTTISNNTNNTNNNIKSNNINENKNISNKNEIYIELEDLIILEEKIHQILNSFKFDNPDPKLCIEWWNYYTYNTYSGKFDLLFSENSDKIISHKTLILELLGIIITYEILNIKKIPKSSINILKSLVNEIHQNFLIQCDYVLTKINFSYSNLNYKWINKLKNIIYQKRKNKILSNEHILLLTKGNCYIYNIINSIIRIYSSNKYDNFNIENIKYFFNNYFGISIQILNEYFLKKISLNSQKKGDNNFLYINNNNNNLISNNNISNLSNNNIKIPFLDKPTTKPFTLVLDLDETLITCRLDERGRYILFQRPYLYMFLKELKNLYEIILFTAGTQEYADPILNIIEKDETFFEKRLYRQHSIIIGNLFVKDLNMLGRNLNKVIIVDNMPQNFRLQKENGIFIRSFCGDNNDTALRDLLPILIGIGNNKDNDVRIELNKMKNEIFEKITTNLNLNEDEKKILN